MTVKKWIGRSGSAWADGANWSPGGAATRLDDATITGPTGTSYEVVLGPGHAASLALAGNTTLSGVFGIGALSVGTKAAPGALRITAGSVVAASKATVGGKVQVSGAGAMLTVAGVLKLTGSASGDGLDVASGAVVQAGGVALRNTIHVDAASAFEVGTVGGAAPGRLTVDAGRVLSGSGSVVAANGILNSGTILAAGGSLSLSSPVDGAGTLRIGHAAALILAGSDSEAVAFNDNSGTLGLAATPVFENAGAPIYTLNQTGAISGFVQGDTIVIHSPAVPVIDAIYKAGTGGAGTLTVGSGAASIGVLTLMGNYAGMSFQATPGPLAEDYRITLTPAKPPQDPLFDTAYYLERNPDVAAAGVDPHQHYLTYGWHEGRNPDALFDTRYYLAQNPDVAAAHVDPLLHYEQYGWHEGRDPSMQFSTAKYLAAYSDVKAAGLDPLLHYVEYGHSEGRTAFAA